MKITELIEAFYEEHIISNCKDTKTHFLLFNKKSIILPAFIFFIFIFIFISDNYDATIIEILHFSIIPFCISFLIGLLCVASSTWIVLFDQENIIVKTLLQKKSIINYKKHPRIYTKHIYDSSASAINRNLYLLYIQQGDQKIEFDLCMFTENQLISFLNNFEYVKANEVTDSILEDSASVDEIEYKAFFKGNIPLQIISVKESARPQKIIVGPISTYRALHVLSIILSLITIAGLVFLLTNIHFYFVEIMLAFMDLYVLVYRCIYRYRSFIKISYPESGKIRIDSETFDYQNNNLILQFVSKETSVGNSERVEYELHIIGSDGLITRVITIYNKKLAPISLWFNDLVLKELPNFNVYDTREMTASEAINLIVNLKNNDGPREDK